MTPPTIARGIGQQPLYGGFSWNFGDDWVWQFRRVGENIHVVRRNVRQGRMALRAHQGHQPLEARQGEPVAADAEERAAQLQKQAREAQRTADELHARAEEATQEARGQRDRVTGTFVDADEIDPDAKHKRS